MKPFLQYLRIINIITLIISGLLSLVGIGIPVFAISFVAFQSIKKAQQAINTNVKLQQREYKMYLTITTLWLLAWMFVVILFDSFSVVYDGYHRTSMYVLYVIDTLLALTLLSVVATRKKLG